MMMNYIREFSTFKGWFKQRFNSVLTKMDLQTIEYKIDLSTHKNSQTIEYTKTGILC